MFSLLSSSASSSVAISLAHSKNYFRLPLDDQLNKVEEANEKNRSMGKTKNEREWKQCQCGSMKDSKGKDKHKSRKKRKKEGKSRSWKT